jgi:hypothetical protein
MTYPAKILWFALCLIGLAMPAGATLTGTINPRNRTISAQTTTSGNFISRADLQALVTARGDLTRAAVISGEAADGTSSTTLATELANAGNPAKFTISITSGISRYSRNDSVAAAGATSGSRFGFTGDSNTFTLGSTVNEKPSHFGAMFYGFAASGNSNLVRVTATFNDSSTAVYNATAATQQYTFVGIAAPIGKWITTVKVDEVTGGDWMCYDDLTVVLAPPAVSFADLEVTDGSQTLNCGFGKTAEYEFTLNNKSANSALWQVLWEGGAPAWASTIPASGSTPGNGASTIRVRANAAGLNPGARTARFAVAPAGTIVANVPQAAWQTVSLNVLEPEFTPASEVFNVGGFVGFAGNTRMALVPAAPGLLDLTGVSSSASWVRPYLSENGGNEVLFSFNPSGLAAGTHSATVTIESAGTIQVFTLRLTLDAQNLVKLLTDPRRNRIYALHQPASGDGQLLALDGGTRATTHALPLGTKPTDLDLSPDGSRLYVAHANGDFRVFNPDSMKQTARHDFATTGSWNLSYDSNVSAGPGDIAYLTDGSWAPYIHVIDTATGTVLQSMLTGPANDPDDTGCGDLVYHPQRRELFTWNQYGWSAGSSVTSLSRFAVAADGRLTLNGRMAPLVNPPNFRRDPLDTPMLLSADGRTLVVKDRRIDMDDMNIQPVVYPQVIYTMTRDGGAVFGQTTAYRGSGGTSVMSVPVSTKVHAISPDGKKLYYFNSGAAALQSVEIESAFGLPMLGVSILPDTDFVTQQQPEMIRWAPVPGAREYRLYVADSAAALSGSSPAASLLAGKTTEHWWFPDRAWPASKYVYWRADAWTNRGVVQGEVNNFYVGKLSLDRHQLAFKSVTGMDGRSETVSITSATPVAWTAGSDSLWLKLSASSGTTPSTLGIRADATNLSEGHYTAFVTIIHSGQWLRLPVEVIVRPRNFTRVVADPDRPHLYVISSNTTDPAQGCFLMRFDTDTERFDRVVEVPYDVRAMAFHRGDQKVYLGYGAASTPASIASVAVPGMTPVVPAVEVPAMDESIAFFSNWESIIPGPAGRLVADKRWEYLIDTADFSLVSNAPRESRAAAFHPSGLHYYAGFGGSRGPIRKYRLENNSFVETASRELSASTVDSSLLVSTDGSRVSWARTIMDADLNELVALPSSILTLTHGGEFAATANRLYNARTGLDVGALPGSSTLQGLNSSGTKLFQFQATTWQRAFLNEMTPLPSDGVIVSLPADGAMVVGPSQTLSWTGVPSVLEYRIFFGTNAAAVAAAGLDDPEYLGSTTGMSIPAPGNLALGAQYHWRIEMVGYSGTVSSPVRSFQVAPINASPVAISLGGPVGVPMPEQQSVPLSSAAPRSWTASTATPWLQLLTPSGTTPGDLRFTVQTTGLAVGTHSGAITLGTSGFPQWQIPVTLVLETANITEALLDPVTGRIYGISQNSNAVVGNNNVLYPAYLVVYNRSTGQPERSVPVGTSVSQVLIHEAENRLYIANWKSGHLRALNRETLAEEALFSFTPYNSLQFGVGDVFSLAPGTAGRLVMGKGPSGSSSGTGSILNLVNTTTGTIIAQSTTGFQTGRMIAEPSGNVIQHFTQAGSGSPARRIGISGDAFSILKQVSQPAITFAGIQTAFRNLAGSRYFAANAVFDSDLNLLRAFDQGQNARALVPGGEIMVSSNRIQNAVTGLQIATLPITSNVMALDDANGRLLMFPGNQLLPTIVDFAALANLPAGDLTPGIASGATVIGTTQQLSWAADARAFSYQVYFGSDGAAVAAAGTGDPEFLGETIGTSLAAPVPLVLDTEYFWRVDAIGRNGTRVGSVWSFRIAPLDIEPRIATIDHPQGVPVATQSIAMTTGPLALPAIPGTEAAVGPGGDSLDWSASTTTPWISLLTSSGVTPDTLRFNVNPAGLSVATHQGAIRITSGGRSFDLPVSLTLRTLNYMMATSDPDRPLLYAISRPDNRYNEDPSFLVLINTNTDTATAAIPVGRGATDVTLHPEENRIYISNWATGELRALDRDSFEQVFYRQYTQPVVGGAEVVHAVAAGRAGRIAITELDQSGQVRLADSATGDILASQPVGAGYGVFDPTKRWLYYGVNSSSSGSLVKFDTQGDQLQQVASASPSNYLPRQIHMNAAGDRLFWGFHMLDTNLNSLWSFGGPIGGLGLQRVAAINPTGEWLLTIPQSGDGALWNTVSRRLMFPIVEFNANSEGTSPYRPYVYNPSAGRFYRVLGNRILTYQTGQLANPVSAPAGVEWLTHGSSRWRAAPEVGAGVLRGGDPAQSNGRSVYSLFVPQAATVSFQWSCNIPNSSHQMALILDTTFQAGITGNTAWTSRSVTVPAGGGMVSWSIRRGTTLGDSISGLVRGITITPLAQAGAARAVNPAMDADDDGDGHSNLIEWATGSDPADPSSRPRLSIEMRDGMLLAEFNRRSGIDGLRVALESSEDLGEWNILDESMLVPTGAIDGIEGMRLILPPEPKRRFLRLRADYDPQP